MITKESLKAEINNIKDENLVILYRIIKALEAPIAETESWVADEKFTQSEKRIGWEKFINETYGSMSDAPIERGNSGAPPC